MTQKKKKKTWLLLLIFAIPFCLFVVFIRQIGDFLVISDTIENVDLITAVSGPEYRIVYAAELCGKRYSNRLFFTGALYEGTNTTEASWSEYIAKTTGVAEGVEIILDETPISSTQDEAVLLKKYIDAHKEEIKSIMIVTDAYHTRRARWIYRQVLGDEIKIVMVPVPFSRTNMSKYWWTNAESRKFVFNEYVKLVFYLFRYDLTTGSVREWLAQFDKY